jgi:CorA-like Mg2+ transporter protein
MSDLLEYPEAKIPPHVIKRWRKTISSIEQRQEKIEVMDLIAQRTYKAINNLFELKSRQADVLEVHLTRKVAQDSARQSTTIMVFTVVTIVFLPLSFMSSFFALNVKEFPRDPKNQNQLYMSLSWVSLRVFGIGIGLAVIIVLLGFGLNELKARLPSREEVFGTYAKSLSDQASGRSSAIDSSGVSPPPPKNFLSGLRKRSTFQDWPRFLPTRRTVIAERLDRVSEFSYESYVLPEELTPEPMPSYKSSPMYESKEGGTTVKAAKTDSSATKSSPSTLTSFFWRSSPSPGLGGRRQARSWDVGNSGYRNRRLFGQRTKTWAAEDDHQKAMV